MAKPISYLTISSLCSLLWGFSEVMLSCWWCLQNLWKKTTATTLCFFCYCLVSLSDFHTFSPKLSSTRALLIDKPLKFCGIQKGALILAKVSIRTNTKRIMSTQTSSCASKANNRLTPVMIKTIKNCWHIIFSKDIL